MVSPLKRARSALNAILAVANAQTTVRARQNRNGLETLARSGAKTTLARFTSRTDNGFALGKTGVVLGVVNQLPRFGLASGTRASMAVFTTLTRFRRAAATQTLTTLRCFVNPPYGREVGLWVRKAYEESLKSLNPK